METIESLVTTAADSSLASPQRLAAFGRIVVRFQDMAYGCAYAILGDFHLAEDAAQEAFLAAYRQLPKLRQPGAFPGWFRRIVISQCRRLTRRKSLPSTALDAAAAVPSSIPPPPRDLERLETKDKVLAAIAALPEHQRMATTLFYINGYSQKDVAEFLEVPLTTVKKRLADSRARLKERMIAMVSDELESHALPEEFPQHIQELLSMPRLLEIPGHPVREIWEAFRSCFPDFEEVELDEILDKSGSRIPVDAMPMPKVVYAIDHDRVLRTDLSRELVGLWLGRGGGPCRLIATGRTFRKGQTESPWKYANVFHQAEVLWVEEGLDDTASIDHVKRVAATLLPNAKIRLSSLKDVGGNVRARECVAEWKGNWLEFGVSGMHSGEVLERCGLDPKRFGAVCIAFGLERCALVRYDIDDIRKLWQPPYVPG